MWAPCFNATTWRLCRYLMNPKASLGDRYGGTYLRSRRAAVCCAGAGGFACVTWLGDLAGAAWTGGFAGAAWTAGFACVAWTGDGACMTWAGGLTCVTWSDALASGALAMAMERAI